MINIIKYQISKSSKILFMGSDNFAHLPLQALYKNFSNLEVVTHHTKQGIKSQNLVSQFCISTGIPFTTPIHKTTKQLVQQQWREYEKIIKHKQYQLGVVCSYGFMIPQNIIKCFNQGMMVVHPSLLPKYRGGAPIFHTIANGDKQSGVSFIELVANKFDAGNILFQTNIQIPLDKQYLQIQTILSNNAAEYLPYVVEKLQMLRPGKKQNLSISSKAPIPKTKMLNLKQQSYRVFNMSRAIKGARVKLLDKQIIVRLKSQYIDVPSEYVPGTAFKVGRKNVFITCGDNKAVKMLQFKQPSKLFFPSTVFINKYLKKQPCTILLQ